MSFNIALRSGTSFGIALSGGGSPPTGGGIAVMVKLSGTFAEKLMKVRLSGAWT